jgi:hypothetical protein
MSRKNKDVITVTVIVIIALLGDEIFNYIFNF